jgi:ABC-type branched-subunit amino acid transport system substrate-binding protein
VTIKRLLALLMALGLVAAACGDADDDAAPTTTAPGDDTAETTAPPDDGEEPAEPTEIETDYGVTDDTIRVGLLADLTGIFAPLVVEIVEAHQVYFEQLNDEGGIAGRQIELVILDAGYDVPRHIELYERMRQESAEGVVMLSLSVGSPHTSAVIADMERDNMIGVPLTWYSGWWDPDFGENAIQMYTHYCIESMNAISFVNDKIREETGEDASTIAIISFPGEYGQDGATGAKLAAEALGLEIVYDGEGQVVPGADQTPVISQLVGSNPDIVFATVNPTTFAEVFGGAVAQGLDARWTGNSPTYNFRLAATDLGPALDQYYTHSTYTAAWGVDVPGMAGLQAAMAERRPDAPVSDVYIVGWTYAQAAAAILEQAAARGDMTRAGMKAAMQDEALTVDFGGLAPNQTWAGGDPDQYTVRESYLYSIDSGAYAAGTVGADDGNTGLVLEAGPFVAQIAEDFEWDGPCFQSQA